MMTISHQEVFGSENLVSAMAFPSLTRKVSQKLIKRALLDANVLLKELFATTYVVSDETAFNVGIYTQPGGLCLARLVIDTAEVFNEQGVLGLDPRLKLSIFAGPDESFQLSFEQAKQYVSTLANNLAVLDTLFTGVPEDYPRADKKSCEATFSELITHLRGVEDLISVAIASKELLSQEHLCLLTSKSISIETLCAKSLSHSLALCLSASTDRFASHQIHCVGTYWVRAFVSELQLSFGLNNDALNTTIRSKTDPWFNKPLDSVQAFLEKMGFNVCLHSLLNP